MARYEEPVPRHGVVVYTAPGGKPSPVHEHTSHMEIAKRLAELQDLEFAGEYDPAATYAGPLYYVPTETIIGKDSADRLGIKDERDLFGAVVAQPFMATKAISHPLLHPDSAAPPGWSAGFSEQVHDSVLNGYSTFTLEDAFHAGEKLLEQGPVRVKSVLATAGRGQSVVSDRGQLAEALEALDTQVIADYGVVLEEHLDKVTTFSVGQIRVGHLVVTYHGTQHLTSDNEGATVYGGSDLVVVRGGFDALLEQDLTEEVRLAVAQAQAYDAAAIDNLPGFFGSRRNYDIAQGIDAKGLPRSGVLEQSWRIGGASSAEVQALQMFHSHPSTGLVRASSHEIYGKEQSVPGGAIILFRGLDRDVGFITKCVTVTADDNDE